MEENMSLSVSSSQSRLQSQVQQLLEEKREREAGRIRIDLREVSFPIAKVGTERCHIAFPLAEIENSEPEEIFGMRGVIVDFGHGLRLYDNSSAKTICRTVGSYFDDGTGNKDFEPRRSPLIKPVIYLEEYNNPKEPNRDIKRWQPKGFRGKMCEDCIRAGEHRIEGDEKNKTSFCSPYASVYMYVTEVLLLVKGPSENVGGRRATPVQPMWFQLAKEGTEEQRNWKNRYDEPFYEKPVTVWLRISSGPLSFKEGVSETSEGRRVKQLHTTSYTGSQDAALIKKPYTPADCQPWMGFLDKVILENPEMLLSMEQTINGQVYSTRTFGQVVEVYATKPFITVNGNNVTPGLMNTIPTFRVVDMGKEYLQNALECGVEDYFQRLRVASEKGSLEEGSDSFYEPEPNTAIPPSKDSDKDPAPSEVLQTAIRSRQQKGMQ